VGLELGLGSENACCIIHFEAIKPLEWKLWNQQHMPLILHAIFLEMGLYAICCTLRLCTK